MSICQARSSSSSTTREYYTEGELLPGSPAQLYYYGVDQIGSVRRAFTSTSNAPAFSYDAYGNALQTTAFQTDVGYAGMFYNSDSGLYLTQFRAYDPVSGRWTSRDPLGKGGDPLSNLYLYVGDNPLSYVDPQGLAEIPQTVPPNIPGGPYSPSGPGQLPGHFYGPAQPKGPRTQCQWVPPESEGGTPGSQGYWKIQPPGEPWQRYSPDGNPLTDEEAHPGSPQAEPPVEPSPEVPPEIPPIIGDVP